MRPCVISGRPSGRFSSTAIEIEKCGMPCRKFVVPSRGSTSQRGLDGLPSISPLSSARTPQSGRALRSSSRIVCSARLSAMETKSAGPLRLTCSCSTSPKSRRSRGAALRTARSMTVIRPEWATKIVYSVGAANIFATVSVHDDAGSARDVGRHHDANAIVENGRLVAGRRRLALHYRVGLDDGRFDLVGELNADRPLVIELHDHVHAVLEEGRRLADQILG